MSIRDIIEKQVRDLQARVVDLDHIRTYFRLFGPYDIEGVRHVALMEAVCEAAKATSESGVVGNQLHDAVWRLAESRKGEDDV